MTFEYPLTVRGYELDSYNHVNNAVYLNYFEQARWELFKKLNLMEYFNSNNLLLVVTEINIKYLREAKLFDELIVKTDIIKEPPYLLFIQKLFNVKSNLRICHAKVKMLLINNEKIPQDLPKELTDAIS
jgi:YbgC/YbaW family acyl-CoA thioester hydrolase